jgi:hypothetical protein
MREQLMHACLPACYLYAMISSMLIKDMQMDHIIFCQRTRRVVAHVEIVCTNACIAERQQIFSFFGIHRSGRKTTALITSSDRPPARCPQTHWSWTLRYRCTRIWALMAYVARNKWAGTLGLMPFWPKKNCIWMFGLPLITDRWSCFDQEIAGGF